MISLDFPTQLVFFFFFFGVEPYFRLIFLTAYFTVGWPPPSQYEILDHSQIVDPHLLSEKGKFVIF